VTTRPAIELRRARPLLGTLVEITARGECEAALVHAIDRSFAAVARVERLMSFHDRHSDVGRVNRLAHRGPVRVHPWTWQVLRSARKLALATRGLFDITIADELVRMGYLPRIAGRRVDPQACSADIELLAGHRVRFRRPLHVDLGGIAKGFAVDRAIAQLRAGAVDAGLVNAGGDLRAFGAVPWRIHLRDPANPGALIPFADIVSGALATSAGYFTRSAWRGRTVSPVIDGLRRAPTTTSSSASVAAPTCMLADALTKVVLLQGPRAHGLVRRLGGRGFILHASAPAAELKCAA
jgi:thiamine biosynthesis lipoprotein